MKVEFGKIGHTAKPFAIESDGVKLECTLRQVSEHRVMFDGRVLGDLELICDRCGIDYDTDINMELKLMLSDEVLNDKVDLDIIEFLDGVVDIDYILNSEINAIKSSYHYCDKCENSDEELSIEI